MKRMCMNQIKVLAHSCLSNTVTTRSMLRHTSCAFAYVSAPQLRVFAYSFTERIMGKNRHKCRYCVNLETFINV